MGIITAAEMCDEIRLHLNKTETDWPDTVCQLPLNQSTLHIASPKVYRHKELEDIDVSTTLVADQSNYHTGTLSTQRTAYLDSLVVSDPDNVTDRWRLQPISEREGHLELGRREAGRPRWYTPKAGSVDLFPAPSDQYEDFILSVRRIVVPTLFDLTTTPNGYSQLHEMWDEAIILGAVWRCWRRLKEWQLAEVTKAETGQLINEIADRMKVEAEDFDNVVDLYNPGVQ